VPRVRAPRQEPLSKAVSPLSGPWGWIPHWAYSYRVPSLAPTPKRSQQVIQPNALLLFLTYRGWVLPRKLSETRHSNQWSVPAGIAPARARVFPIRAPPWEAITEPFPLEFTDRKTSARAKTAKRPRPGDSGPGHSCGLNISRRPLVLLLCVTGRVFPTSQKARSNHYR